MRPAALALLLLTMIVPDAGAQVTGENSETTAAAAFIARTRAFMARLASGNRTDARRIAADYGDDSRVNRFADRESMASAIAAGLIRPLPDGAGAIRVRPRLAGAHPVGELDLDFQRLYVAAHPAAIECLMRIAASLPHGTLDVTSLVRHQAYQQRLSRANPNATRRGSMHTTGLAFDISVLNVPSSTATAIADVLLAMRAAGDLYFLAETRQLVFHVVPAASRVDEWLALRAAVDVAGEPAQLAASRPALTLRSAGPAPRAEPLLAGVVSGGPLRMVLVGGMLFLAGTLLRGRRYAH